MQLTTNTLRKAVNQKLAEQSILTETVENEQQILHELAQNLEVVSQAQVAIKNASEITQKQLQQRISAIITLALAAIFEDPYEFLAKFSQRRNNVECDLLFKRRGQEMRPLDDSGFGSADVASLALRFSVWKGSGTRPVLFFDEPGRNLSEKYRKAFGAMLQMLCQKLSVQVIIITHMQEILDSADKIFVVSCKKDIATVEELT